MLWQFALRTVELRHKGSHLGLIWSFLSPLIMLALYVLVFGYIFGGSFGVIKGEGPVDYGLGIFLGLAIFNFASDLLSNTAAIILENTNLVKKVVFPLEVLPAANVLAALIHLSITLVLVFTGLALFGRWPGASALLLPVVVLPLFMGGLGIAWMMSALGVFLRDIRQILPAMSTGLMFASAVFYSAAKIPPAAWAFLKFNPVVHAVLNARAVVLWGHPLDPFGIIYLYITGTLMMFIGLWTFNRLRPSFADVM